MPRVFIDPPWKKLRDIPDKLLKAYFYCWHKADRSGVYEYDDAYIRADLKESISFEELCLLPDVKNISTQKILFKEFLHVTDFGIIQHGYNPHKPIFKLMEKNGIENYFGLGLKIQTGVKENKKNEALECFFKIENKNSIPNLSITITEEEVEEEVEEDGGMGEEKKVEDNSETSITPVFQIPTITDIDLLLEKVLLDAGFRKNFYDRYQFTNDLLRLWLENFNKWLKHTAQTAKTETDYRKHFSNWIAGYANTNPNQFNFLKDGSSKQNNTKVGSFGKSAGAIKLAHQLAKEIGGP